LSAFSLLTGAFDGTIHDGPAHAPDMGHRKPRDVGQPSPL
jgi:hypothetical protein